MIYFPLQSNDNILPHEQNGYVVYYWSGGKQLMSRGYWVNCK